MPTPTLDPVYSIREVATHLGISEKTVRRWIANGDLSHHRLGRQIRITHADIQTFIKTRRK